MKKSIRCCLLAGVLLLPIYVTQSVDAPWVSHAQEVIQTEEYTSENNPVKPSEAPDDYEIYFEDKQLEAKLKADQRVTTEKITVGDLKGITAANFIYDIGGSPNFSVEGLQYLPSRVTGITLKNGTYTDGILTPLKGRLTSFSFQQFGLTSIPEITEFKNIRSMNLMDNKITDISNIGYYPDLTGLTLKNNEISDISPLRSFRALLAIDFDGNKISDITPIKASQDTLITVRFRSNQLTNQSMEELFHNANFAKWDGAAGQGDATFAMNGITDFSSMAQVKPWSIYTGKQRIIKILDQPEFELPLVGYARAQREFVTSKAKLDGVFVEKISADENDASYRLNEEALDDTIIYEYWNKNQFTNQNIDMVFSGLVEIVNLMPLNRLIMEAQNDRSPDKVTAASAKLEEVRQATTGMRSTELNEKLDAAEASIASIQTDEYTSAANPIPPSKAKDEQVVNFTSRVLEYSVRASLARELGEGPDVITVGDMRKLTVLVDTHFIKDVLNSIEGRQVSDLEGLQYAENLKQISLSIDGADTRVTYDDDFNVVSVTRELQEKFGEQAWTGNMRVWTQEWIDEVVNKEVHTLKPLKNLTKMEGVGLNGGDINSYALNDLSNMKNLRAINLNSTFVHDLTPLSHLMNMERIDIRGGFIEDITPVTGLKKLDVVHLTDHRINDWTPLAELPNLRAVFLLRNLTDYSEEHVRKNLSIFPGMKHLEALSLVLNGIVDISPLAGLADTSLLRLYLDGNSIVDYTPLANIKGFSNDPYSANRLHATLQRHVFFLEDGNYRFDLPIKLSDGKEVYLDLVEPIDTDLKRVEGGTYQLTSRTTMKVIRPYSSYNAIGTVTGHVFVYNMNEIEKRVNAAIENPTSRNLERAQEALLELDQVKQKVDYVNQTQAKLNALTPKEELPTVIPAVSVTLNKTELTLERNASEKLTATVSPANSTQKDIEWTSSDPFVAIVEQDGTVKALSEGMTDITAKVKGTDISVTAKVTVTKASDPKPNEPGESGGETGPTDPKPDTSVKAISLRLNRTAMEIERGNSFQLFGTINPLNSDQKEILWTSNNDAVARVNSSGLVEARGVGSAVITARIKGTEISASVNITVTAPAQESKPEESKPQESKPQESKPQESKPQETDAQSLSLDASKIDLYVGDKESVKATVKPDGSKQKTIEWTSSDDKIVKVDASGNLEAIGIGSAVITAKVKDTDLKKEVEVIVTQRPQPITPSNFIDIATHWAKAYIEHATSRGLFAGTSDTTFSPDMNMTRGMFVTVLGKMSGEQVAVNDAFHDVPSDAYYAKHVAWAQSEGIVTGYGNGQFGPDNNVTREEMAVIIEKYMKYKGISLPTSDVADFADLSSVSDWAKESVSAVQQAGIIVGKGEGIFDPSANSTRAEVATLLVNMMDRYMK